MTQPLPVPGGWLPLGTNVHLPVRVGAPFNEVAAPLITTQLRHGLTGAPTSVRLVYANWRNEGGRDVPGANPLRLEATVETAHGGPRTVLFAGAPDVTLAPGRIVVSDPVALGAAATALTSTTRVRPVEGDRVPLGPQADTRVGESVRAATPQDSPIELNHGFGPSQILGIPSPGEDRCVLVVGDSNAVGFGDRRGDADHFGWVRRLFDGRRLVVNASTSGATAAGALAAGSATRRSQLASAAVPGLAVVALGTNDLQRGGDVAAVQAALSALWRDLRADGWRIAAVTVPPVSESSDSWRTIDGQTPTPGAPARHALNAWLRGHPDGVDEVWDLAEGVTGAKGRWAPRMTLDGVHLSPLGHATVAQRFAHLLR